MRALITIIEKGAFSKIPVFYEDASKTVVIGPREGSFDGMMSEREFRVVYIHKEQPKPLDSKEPPDQKINYNGTEITIKL